MISGIEIVLPSGCCCLFCSVAARRYGHDQYVIIADQNELQSLAVRWFGEALGLTKDEANGLLTSRIMINSLDEGRIISEQGSTDNSQLVLVLTGNLKVTQDAAFDDEDADNGDERWLALVQPREMVGGLQLLSNG